MLPARCASDLQLNRQVQAWFGTEQPDWMCVAVPEGACLSRVAAQSQPVQKAPRQKNGNFCHPSCTPAPKVAWTVLFRCSADSELYWALQSTESPRGSLPPRASLLLRLDSGGEPVPGFRVPMGGSAVPAAARAVSHLRLGSQLGAGGGCSRGKGGSWGALRPGVGGCMEPPVKQCCVGLF